MNEIEAAESKVNQCLEALTAFDTHELGKGRTTEKMAAFHAALAELKALRNVEDDG